MPDTETITVEATAECAHTGTFAPTVDIKTAGATRITTVTGLRCQQCGLVFRQSGVAATGSIIWSPRPQPQPKPAKVKIVTPEEGEAIIRGELGDGPGTLLAIRFFHKGVPTCQACKDLARKMNSWGVSGCREHMGAIVDDMLPRFREWIAKEKPWAGKLFSAISIVGAADAAARLAIRTYVNDVIDQWDARRG